MSFSGFEPRVFEWFEGLERDNSREYFMATRDLYEREVRGGLEALLEALADELGGLPKVFRQHRDLRFSADKSPYKTRTYGALGGLPSAVAGLYVELSSGGLYAGTGYYRMARDQLERYRAAVDEERTGAALADAVAAAEDAGLEPAGEGVRTAPRGYPRDHPRIELLRRKSLFAGARLAPGGGIPGDAALAHALNAWNGAARLNAWLDAHVGESRMRDT